MSLTKALVNAAIFDLGWFVCTFFGDRVAVSYTIAALMVHFLWMVERSSWRFESVVILSYLVLGVVIESLYLYFGVIISDRLPIWILMLWVLFATLLNHSLSWFKGRAMLAAVLTAIAAPWSYYAGAAINDAVELGQLSFSLSVIAISWAIVIALTYYLLKRLTPEAIK